MCEFCQEDSDGTRLHSGDLLGISPHNFQYLRIREIKDNGTHLYVEFLETVNKTIVQLRREHYWTNRRK